MKKTILAMFAVLFLASCAHAEYWVCFDEATTYFKRKVVGDGVALGLCEANNANIVPYCIWATKEEYDAAKDGMKVDVKLDKGKRVIALSTKEKDVIVAAETAAVEEAKDVAVTNLDVTVKDVFTAFIKVYNSKMPVQYRISGEELILQLKTDMGIAK